MPPQYTIEKLKITHYLNPSVETFLIQKFPENQKLHSQLTYLRTKRLTSTQLQKLLRLIEKQEKQEKQEK